LGGLSFLSIDAVRKICWEVVRDMNGGKALGLDGFFMACFQKCWEVMKEGILAVFKEFHSRGKFEKNFNANFVCFIPKKAGAVDIEDFRPISFVGGLQLMVRF
jgi:hypothetical protein